MVLTDTGRGAEASLESRQPEPFQSKLKVYGMKGSMSRKGNCWNHAPTEMGGTNFKREGAHGLRDDTRAR